MDVIVADTSVLLDYFDGRATELLDDALSRDALVVPPLAIAEVFSGEITPAQRVILGELLQDAPLHRTPLKHWMDVGELRRALRRRGINVNLPDAHVAQCAIELDALLLTRDGVFAQIALHTPLRVTSAAT